MKNKIISLTVCLVLILVGTISSTLAYYTDTETRTNVFTVGKVDITLTEPEWHDAEGYEYNEDNPAIIMPGKELKKDPTVTVVAKTQPCWVFLEIDMNKYISLINLMGVHAYINDVGNINTNDTDHDTYPGPQALLSAISDTTLRATIIGNWFQGINHADWKVMNQADITNAIGNAATSTNPTNIKIVLGYQGGTNGGILNPTDEVTFMQSFTMPGTVTQSMLDGDDAYKVGTDNHSASNFNTVDADWKMTFTAYAIQSEGFATIDAAYTALKGDCPAVGDMGLTTP